MGLLLLKRGVLEALAAQSSRRMPLEALRKLLPPEVDPEFFVEQFVGHEVALVGGEKYAELRPLRVWGTWGRATGAPRFPPACKGCRLHLACCAFVHAQPRVK